MTNEIRQTPGSIRRAERKARVFDAAAALFAEHGFTATTTSQIAERADVAAGTVFRYAATKGELLIAVYNNEFRRAVERGNARAQSESDLPDAVLGLVRDIADFAWQHPENSVAYQRELLFGATTDNYRAEGLAQIEQLEETIAALLIERAEQPSSPAIAAAARSAGAAVFAVLHIAIARIATGTDRAGDRHDDLRAQIRTITLGFLAESQASR